MRKYILIFSFVGGFGWVAHADPGDVGPVTVINTIRPKNHAFLYTVISSETFVSTAPFTGNLNSTDYNVQRALNTIDKLNLSSGTMMVAGAYGAIYSSSSPITQMGISTTPVQAQFFDTNGISLLTTPDASNGQILISSSGPYAVFANYVSTIISPNGYYSYYSNITVNGSTTPISCVQAQQSGETTGCTMSGILSLTAGSTIAMEIVTGNTNSTSITVHDAQLFVASIGGSGGGSGTPGGSNTQFQFNNSGSFGGSPDLITNGSTVTITNTDISTMTVEQNSTFVNVSTFTISLSTMTFQSGTVLDTTLGTLYPPSLTLSALHSLSPPAAGVVYYCSDCTVDGLVISTGTSISALGRISSRTTSIQ